MKKLLKNIYRFGDWYVKFEGDKKMSGNIWTLFLGIVTVILMFKLIMVLIAL